VNYWVLVRFIQDKKKGCRGHPFRNQYSRLLAVALTELVDLFRGLQNVLLARVKRMRLARNFKLQQWILFTVFPLDCFPGRNGRLGQDRKIRRNVLEHDLSIFGMNFLFHVAVAIYAGAKGRGF